ncbi:sporulation protein [Paraliobacillus quinghaiensis]|uniref:Sporulation protein n=1 Tax=Paraliobacillus quinghaiensis TaxID=470815 RepID=A0A917WS78_9BACI|nr:GerMN domain-containing protein [Paraliobacillus quinghaiensis]GGM27049.1 sporulation protein [Paraliobacillus quinghaiensis]
MRKQMSRLTIRIGLPILFVLFFTTGCGFFQGEQTLEEIDVPATSQTSDEEANADSDVVDEASDAEVTTVEVETVPRELYLINEEGMVVPQTVELPKPESNEVAAQVLEYLIKDGPVTNILPNGFEAVLPANTEILGLTLQPDGTLIVDVSNEFTEYQAEEEQQIIQAMTYTLTQFENVDRVTLWINGYEQTEMPVNGTPLSEGYSRANGINIHYTDGVDLMDSEAVTLYYPTQQGEQFYYVPVTQHVEMVNDNLYQSVVQALLEGPSYDLDLLHVFNNGASLIEEPTVEDGVLHVTFNKEILSNESTSAISDEVMETLVLTLTNQMDINSVSVKVEEIEQVFNEHGVPYSEPVSREAFVPTGSL